MTESTIAYDRNIAAFRTQHDLTQAVRPILSELGVPGPTETARSLAKEARRDRERSNISYREIGNLVVSVIKQADMKHYVASFGATTEEDEPSARELNRRLREAPSVELLTTAGHVSLPVRDTQEAAQFIEATLTAIPMEQEIDVPDAYLGGPYPRFQMRRDGDIQAYATALLGEEVNEDGQLEGRKFSLYRTTGGLTTYVSSYATGEDTQAMTVSVMNVRNPFIGRPHPLTDDELQLTQTLLSSLQERLEYRS